MEGTGKVKTPSRREPGSEVSSKERGRETL